MTPFLTNARFAETGDVPELGAEGLAAAGEAVGDGAARKEPLGDSTKADIARAIASPTPRRNHRRRVLKKDTPNTKD